MRVLHVITRLIGGGAQLNTLRTACLHRRAGVEAELLYGSTDAAREGALIEPARAAGLPLRHLPSLTREPSPRDDARALAALVRLLHQERFDLVHTHTSKAGFLGRLAARLTGGLPVVHTPHGHVFHSYYGPLTTRFYVMLERAAAGWADALVALTPSERREHLDYGIGDPSSFHVIPSGIDLERFAAARAGREAARRALGLAPGEPVIGSVGRLAPVKGHAVLVEAFARMVRGSGPASLVLVGDGEERERLRAQAAAAGIAHRVTFLGRLDDPAPVLAAFDVMAVPSLNEGMGRVVLEAMAAHVPVVASSVGGIPDLVEHGVTGLLVPPADAGALAGALRASLGSPAAAAARAQAAAARAGPAYGEQAMADRLLALYRAILAATSA